MKVDMKSILVKVTSSAGFLHLLRFTLSLWTVVGLHFSHISGDLEMYLKCEPHEKCPIYVTGSLWSFIVALLGLLSLAVFITSLFLDIKRIILIVYYFVGAFLVLFVACLGTGINQSVDYYNKCTQKRCSYTNFPLSPVLAGYYGMFFGVSCIHALLYAFSGMIEVNKFCEGTGNALGSAYGDAKYQPGSPQSEKPVDSASQQVA